MSHPSCWTGRQVSRRERGQGLVEAALSMPAVVLVVVGLIAVSRLLAAQGGVQAVAYEAARSAALADTAEDARALGEQRGADLAEDQHLTNGSLQVTVDARTFGRGEPVCADVTYTVAFDDLPLLSWAHRQVSAEHTERVEAYRSILVAGTAP